MSFYLLGIDKKPRLKNDHLSFVVYEELDNPKIFGGLTLKFRAVENFLNPSPIGINYDKEGKYQGYINTKENENIVFYKINNNFEKGKLTKIAKEIIENTIVYEEQYKEFIQQARQKFILKKLD